METEMGLRMLVSIGAGALERDASGVTAIEYGLIAGAIAVAIIATVLALGGDISNLFGTTGNAVSNVVSSQL
jgi:pilus assembly protein Flp/PilA